MLFTIKYLAIFVIFTLVVTSCTAPNTNHAGEINAKASHPADFKFQQKGLKVITSSINKRANTTSVLYGNAVAQKFAKQLNPTDSTGVVMTLVTWNQEDDDRWFGARIPGNLLCVETVTITGTANKPLKSFGLYSGASLTKQTVTDALESDPRITFILSQKASMLP